VLLLKFLLVQLRQWVPLDQPVQLVRQVLLSQYQQVLRVLSVLPHPLNPQLPLLL
jgi:hypothetical protein